MICAACGKAGESLKLCTACNAVGYCNASCKKKHRKKHRKECILRASEATDQEITSRLKSLSISVPADLDDPNSDLWKSPPRQECPICMLSLYPFHIESKFWTCCGKIVCGGCDMKHSKTIDENRAARRTDAPLVRTCPFCREPVPTSEEEALGRLKTRMEMKDSEAFVCMVDAYHKGLGVPKNERKKFEYILCAVELGNANAYSLLAEYYRTGKFVDADEQKFKEYAQLAAMGGNITARLNLFEYKKKHYDLAIRHWQIAAGVGVQEALDKIKEAYMRGIASKTSFAETLRAYQVAQEEMMSEARE